MANAVPKNSDEFIQNELDSRARMIERTLKSDLLTICSPIVHGVDDYIRTLIEEKVRNSPLNKALPVKKRRLHVIVTTPGGFIEVVQRIVDTLRYHYGYVAFIVPNYAFSAGTVLAMSGDDILMDYYSRLGPIDPQVETADGKRLPALGYLERYNKLIEKAQKGELTTDEAKLLIYGFDQAELYQYDQQRELSVAMLEEWLAKYKFKDWIETETTKKPVDAAFRASRAREIGKLLNNTEKWHSHGYGISMNVLIRDVNLRIVDYEKDGVLHKHIKDYHDLLNDYLPRVTSTGILHAPPKQYVIF